MTATTNTSSDRGSEDVFQQISRRISSTKGPPGADQASRNSGGFQPKLKVLITGHSLVTDKSEKYTVSNVASIFENFCFLLFFCSVDLLIRL